MNKRVFVLTVEVSTSGDEKIDGNLEIIKDSLEDVLSAKEDLKKFFGYNNIKVVSIKEIWITDKSSDTEQSED